jgi:hypothetical protein
MRRYLRLPLLVNAVLIALGALTLGAKASIQIAPLPPAETVFAPGSTDTLYSVKTVKRVVRGRILHRNQKVYILVPLVVVHTDHHTIRVPAHRLPLHDASATIVNPLVTVYVGVPTTVFVPTTVTTTETFVSTLTVPTTITIPLTEGGGPVS